jgi:hypothetical protein
MFSPTLSYYKRNGVARRSTLLRYLSPPTLAVVLLVTFALLPNVGGRESKKTSLDKTTTGDVVIKLQVQTPCLVAPTPVRPEHSLVLSAMQSIASMVDSFRKAFNDPALIDYANQQGIGIPGSTEASLSGGTSQQSSNAARISDP